jgi:hypothetical protein
MGAGGQSWTGGHKNGNGDVRGTVSGWTGESAAGIFNHAGAVCWVCKRDQAPPSWTAKPFGKNAGSNDNNDNKSSSSDPLHHQQSGVANTTTPGKATRPKGNARPSNLLLTTNYDNSVVDRQGR